MYNHVPLAYALPRAWYIMDTVYMHLQYFLAIFLELLLRYESNYSRVQVKQQKSQQNAAVKKKIIRQMINIMIAQVCNYEKSI